MSGGRPRVPQLPLALQLDRHAVFEAFIAGGNGAALAHVQAVAAGQRAALWLAGPAAVGKSHILQAACRAAAETGRRAMYLPLDAAEVEPALLADLEALDLLALDGLDAVAGRAEWERRLFKILNAAAAGELALLMAARAVPAAVGFALPDLASRAAGAVVYRLQPLGDADQVEALLEHARRRGVEMDPAAARWLQARVPRDMAVLMAWIERLDAASLAAQRRVTVPFVREMVAELSAGAPAQQEQQRKLHERGQQHERRDHGAAERGDDLHDGGPGK